MVKNDWSLLRYVAIFFPMKHLTHGYRRYLNISLVINWLFSVTIGVWQGWVHDAGPSARCHTDDQDYWLCGAREQVAKSIFIPFTAVYIFLPLFVTVGINSSISMKLILRDKSPDQVGCASCRLGGGSCHVSIEIIRL